MGLILAFVLGFLPAAHAEALSPKVVQTLGARAESVVRGEVLHQRLDHDSDGVWTISTVRVTETLQGTSEPIREIRLPGGRLEDLEVMVAKAPRLLPGDEVLLFLKGDRIVSLGQGAFVIYQDRAWRALDAWTFGRADSRKTLTSSLELSQVRTELSRDGASSDHPSSAAN